MINFDENEERMLGLILARINNEWYKHLIKDYKSLYYYKRVSLTKNIIEEIWSLDIKDTKKIENLLRKKRIASIISYELCGQNYERGCIRLRDGREEYRKKFVDILYSVLKDKVFHVWFRDWGVTDGFWGDLKLIKNNGYIAEVVKCGFSEGGG